jgi:phosphoglycolate phosphatase
MKKLAVLFPGIGYTIDKPLLYYSRRIAGEHDYEILPIAYSGFPKKVKGDRKRMEESFSVALSQSEERLAEVDLCSYDDILFIGKSIGTIVAAKIASESQAKEKIRLVLYTPLPDTFSFPFGKAIVFTGTDDPWVGKEKSRIGTLCVERKIPYMLIPHGNHSLESGNIQEDMEALKKVLLRTEAFLRKNG